MPTSDNHGGKNTMEDIDLREALVLKQLENLKVNETPGPHGLHSRLVKELSNE